MKKIFSIFLLLPFFALSQITITVTLSGTPNAGTKVVPADLKYNKQGHFDFTQDDRGTGALLASIVYSGGSYNGVTYSGLTFTDGANVRGRSIYYTGSVATNSWANADTLSDFSTLGTTYMNWAQMDTMLRKGWSILDHGAFHGVSQPGAVNLGFTPLMNSAANRNYTFRKLSAYGDQYVMRYGVVPSADSGYHSAWEQEGYVGGTSQNAFDNYTAEPQYDWWNGGIGIVTNYKNDNRYHVQARRFKDFTAPDFWADYKPAFDALLAQSSSSVKANLDYGIHMFNIDSFSKAMTYLQTNAADRIWVCGLQEFYEYFYVIQQTRVTQSLSGNVLTVTLDQSFLADETRWRDMSFLLNSAATISSVTVTGADDYSYNTTTGLINIYKKKTSGFAPPPYYNATGFVKGKIPLQDNDLFIDNNYKNFPSALIDGNTSIVYNASDAAMIYSPYVVTVDLTDYGPSIDSIKIYRSGTSGFTSNAVLHRNDNDGADTVGTWSGGSGWITFKGPFIGKRYVASRLELVSTSVSGFGNELEIYATYSPYTEQSYPHRHTPLGEMAGVNGYVWNFIENGATTVNENKVRAFDSMKVRSLRMYADAPYHSTNNGGNYAFDPNNLNYYEDKMLRRLKLDNPKLTRWSVLQKQTPQVKQTWQNAPTDVHQVKGKVVSYTDNGSYGTLVLSAFFSTGTTNSWWRIEGTPTNGIPTQFPDINTVTVPTTFPSNVTFYINPGLSAVIHVNDTMWARSIETSLFNITHANNTLAGRLTLNTWDSAAKLSYVYAARRGKNVNATKFMPFTSTSEPWKNNNDSVGLGTNDWFENMNEPNAWWAGYNDDLNGKILAIAWSKTYDNNKVYSTTLGFKNADTGTLVSHSGLAIATVDLNRAAEVYTRALRGSRPKSAVPLQPTYWKARTWGWTDNPYDAIQFHNYAYTGGAVQWDNGGIKSGVPMEYAISLAAVDNFVWFRNKYAPTALVDVGEWGIDVNQGSNMNAPPIAPYNIEEVRGAWALRTMLLYNVHGVDKAQWFRLYQDNDGDTASSTQFNSMAWARSVNNDPNNIVLTIAGRYVAQFEEWGDFVYDSTLRSDSVQCYRFSNGSNYLYTTWKVENWPNRAQSDGFTATQKAQFTNRTGIMNLPISQGSTIYVRKPQDNGNTMSSTQSTVGSGGYNVNVDLMPVFVTTNAPAVFSGGRFIYRKGSRIIVKQF